MATELTGLNRSRRCGRVCHASAISFVLVIALGAGRVLGQSYGGGYSLIQDLGSFGAVDPSGKPVQTIATGINNNGEVAGYATTSNDTRTHIFRWNQATGLTDLGGFAGSAVAYGINDEGQILGDTSVQGVPNGNGGNFILDSTGSHPLPTGFNIDELRVGTGIGHRQLSNAGQVTGYQYASNGAGSANYHAVLFSPSAQSVTDLGVPVGFQQASGTSVNDLGHVLAIVNNNGLYGQTGTIYDGSHWTSIGVPSGWDPAKTGLVFGAISHDDFVVGSACMQGQSDDQAFLWTPTGGMKLLGPGSAYDINNMGAVVGRFGKSSSGPLAAVFQNGVTYNLDAMLIPRDKYGNRPSAGWVALEGAIGINDLGQIIGLGQYVDPVSHQLNDYRSFILQPLGSSQYFPVQPNQTGAGGSKAFFGVCSYSCMHGPSTAPFGDWYDPPLVGQVRYAAAMGTLFSSIADFPVGYSQPFTVSVNGTVLGRFAPGDHVNFTDYAGQLGALLVNGQGVQSFAISEITSSDQSITTFPLKIALDTAVDGSYRFSVTPMIPGDANGDGKVDFADLVTLARHYGQTNVLWPDGDFDGDGKVDFADLVALARNYGTGLTAAQLAQLDPAVRADVERAFADVPEPSSLAPLSLGCAVLLHRRRTRRAGCRIVGRGV